MRVIPPQTRYLAYSRRELVQFLWKNGRMEGWKNGRVEEKIGILAVSLSHCPAFPSSSLPVFQRYTVAIYPIFSIILLFAMLSSSLFAQTHTTFHSYKVETIDGQEFDLSQLKGKKVLVVNTASKCGLTPQYKELEEVYEQYGGDKFVIIGFPANDFMGQEPGTNGEIIEFCQKNYGVSFPMMAKISVKGKEMAPVYEWLTTKELNGKLDSKVKWNFQKYLVDEKGELVDFVAPSDSPKSEKIINWITN